MLAIRVWNWNAWCRNMRLRWRLRWRLRAHQHLAILGHVFAAADVGLLSRLAHTQEGDSADTPPLTLLPGEPLTPGISRFEQLLRHLIAQITPSIRRRYPRGRYRLLFRPTAATKVVNLTHSIVSGQRDLCPSKAEVHLQEAGPSLAIGSGFGGSKKSRFGTGDALPAA